MLKHNEVYKKVKEDRVADNGAFDSEYMMHWVGNSRPPGVRGSEGVTTMVVNSKV
jgi:hypothetical protein